MQRRRLLALSAAGVAWVQLAGCGFELRRAPQMPFSSIALIGFAPRSPLAADLRTALASQVRVLDAPGAAEVVLEATEDGRDRSVVASTSAGQVREMQLRVRLHFRAHTGSGRLLIAPAELLLTRDMLYNETAALGKQQEEEELFRDMQRDVVNQVLRRLAAVQL
jgi:LPS-assembly lipoprotein